MEIIVGAFAIIFDRRHNLCIKPAKSCINIFRIVINSSSLDQTLCRPIFAYIDAKHMGLISLIEQESRMKHSCLMKFAWRAINNQMLVAMKFIREHFCPHKDREKIWLKSACIVNNF